MPSTSPDYFHILQVLTDHHVDFILVGGVCAVLHGAPVSTFDIDLVHARTDRNIANLLEALDKLNARFRDPAGRDLRVKASHLESPGHQLLITSAGPLDLLGVIGDGKGFDDLLPQSSSVDLEGLTIRLLDLETLIETKEAVGHEKDLATLPILRRLLRERGGD
jgi:predicted nucleotidyltransferase